MMGQKRFNWKLFIILWFASIVGVAAVIPYTLTVQGPEVLSRIPIPLWVLIPIQVAQNAVIFGIATGIGLLVAYRIGLGAPILEAWTAGQPVRDRIKSILVPSIVLGVIAGLLVIALDVLVFAPTVQAELGNLQRLTDPAIKPPAWQGLLASLYGAIDEEILMRLFLLSLLAFFGKFVSHTPDGRPTLGVLWTANILVAILFGLGHLPITSALAPLTPLIVTRAIVLNGVAGIAFGYLYFTRGLESAMLAHFSTDIVLHVLLAL